MLPTADCTMICIVCMRPVQPREVCPGRCVMRRPCPGPGVTGVASLGPPTTGPASPRTPGVWVCDACTTACPRPCTTGEGASYELIALLTKPAVLFPPPRRHRVPKQNHHFGHDSPRFGSAGRASAARASAVIAAHAAAEAKARSEDNNGIDIKMRNRRTRMTRTKRRGAMARPTKSIR